MQDAAAGMPDSLDLSGWGCFTVVSGIVLTLGRLGHTFLLFSPGTAPWSGLEPSQRFRNGPDMLLDQVSSQTVDSGPDSGHF